MPIASKYTYLIDAGAASGAATWGAGLCEINSYSDLEGDMETGDTTTLSDSARTSIPTIRAESAWTFEANFDKTDLAALKALEDSLHYYGVYHGGTLAAPTGDDGKTRATGYLTAREKGAAVGDVVKMEIKIALATEPVTGEAQLTSVTLGGAPQVGVATSALTLAYNISPNTPTLAYVWKIATTESGSYSNISGATSATYTPVEGDVGKYIKCEVTATVAAEGVVLSNALVVIAA